MIRALLPLLLLAACDRNDDFEETGVEDTAAESTWQVLTVECPLEAYNESWGVLVHFEEVPVYVQADLCYFEDAADEVWCWQNLDSYLTPSRALIVRADWCSEYEDATFRVAYTH